MKKLLFIAVILFALPATVLAANDVPATSVGGNTPAFCQGGICTYIPLEPLPCPTGAPGSCQTGTGSFGGLLAAIFKIFFTIGAMLAVVMMVVTGIGYMISDTPVKLEQAKTRMWAAIKGLLLLAGAWLLIYTINPNLLNFQIFGSDLQNYSRRQGSAQQTNGPSVIQTQPVPTAQQIQDAQSRCTSGKVAPDQNNNLVCYPNI